MAFGLELSNINWNRPADKKQAIVFGAIMIAIFVLFYRLAMSSTAVELSQLSKDFDDAELQIATTRDFIQTLREAPKLAVKGAKLTTDSPKMVALQQADKTVPEVGFAKMVKVLTTPGMMKGLMLMGLEIMEVSQQEGYQRIPVSIMVKGNFLEISRYVKRIENMPLLINVSHVELNATAKDYPDLDAILETNFYILI